MNLKKRILHIHPHEHMLINNLEYCNKATNYEHHVAHHEFINLDHLKKSPIIKEIHVTARINRNPLLWIIQIRRICKNYKFDIIHSNSGWFDVLLIPALLFLPGKKISHMHGISTRSSYLNSLKKCIIALLIENFFDLRLAASKTAGASIYKKFNVIKNIVPYKKYKFDEGLRVCARKKIGLEENQILFGHVGLFFKEKNHIFLLNVFAKLPLKNKKLILVGNSGDNFKELILREIKRLQIEDLVIFSGYSSSIREYLCAMDVFLFPSTSEGFGMALLEAQIAGLPSVCSTGVPEEALISKNSIRLDLSEPIQVWVDACMSMAEIPKCSRLQSDNVLDKSFDANQNSCELIDSYEFLLNNS